MGTLRVIDLSISVDDARGDPFPNYVQVSYEQHEQTAAIMAEHFGCRTADLPQGLGWAHEVVKLGSHAGTHLDAPWHYFPTSEGKRARTIDEVPLEWCRGQGVVLDMRHLPQGAAITIEDLEKELKRIGYSLKARDIVLLHTGASKYWGSDEYFGKGCGLNRESTMWILDHQIKVIGTDAWSLDRPFPSMRADFERTRDPRVIWPAHRVGIEKEYCHIEKLTNLDKLPRPWGFEVMCFPVKLKGGSAAWCRAVALVSE